MLVPAYIPQPDPTHPPHGRAFSSDEDGDGPMDQTLLECRCIGQNVRGLSNDAMRKALFTTLADYAAVALSETTQRGIVERCRV